MIKGYEYQSDFARRHDALGRAQGYIEGATRAVLIVLQARGLAVPDAVRERILAEKDLQRLKCWLKKAAVASSVAAVFDETAEDLGA